MEALNILIAGAAGQGVQSAAAILGKTLHRLGFFVHTSQDYQSRVRGGHNFMKIRFSDCRLSASARRIDFLLALNNESLHRHLRNVTDDGLALCSDKDAGEMEDPRLRPLAADAGPEAASSLYNVEIRGSRGVRRGGWTTAGCWTLLPQPRSAWSAPTFS